VSTPPAEPGGVIPGEPASALDETLRAAAGADRCPRCGTEMVPGQYWCLGCGFAARTQVAVAPRWRWPIVALALAGVLALAGLVYGFVKLSEDTGRAPTVTPTGPTVPVPAPAPVPTGPTQPATAPGAGGATGPAGQQ
jgi:hypothetical protein